jgi:hypothetical protein
MACMFFYLYLEHDILFFYFIDRVDGPCTHDRVVIRGGCSRRRSLAADREDVRGPIPAARLQGG